jgi:hypothetical protein
MRFSSSPLRLYMLCKGGHISMKTEPRRRGRMTEKMIMTGEENKKNTDLRKHHSSRSIKGKRQILQSKTRLESNDIQDCTLIALEEA